MLTAHPTEVNRRTLLRKHNNIARLLAQLDRATPDERPQIESALECVITEIWCTDELHRSKPTPLDEAQAGLLIFEHRLWNAVPKYLRILDHELLQSTGEGLALTAAPIRFGSWMGGDRDGNPNVTPSITRKAWGMGRWMAADLYWRELEALRTELSLDTGSSALLRRTGNAAEPYRALLRVVRDKLANTRSWAARVMEGELPEQTEEMVVSVSDLWEPLQLCYDSLVETGCELIAPGTLSDILRRLSVFGLCLVRLAIRQESERPTEAMDAITKHLGLGSYAQWAEADKQSFYPARAQQPAPPDSDSLPASPEVQDVLDTFREIARTPSDSLGAYVISMATEPSDVL